MNRSYKQAISLLWKAKTAETWPKSLACVEKAYALLVPKQKSEKVKATRARVRARKAARSEVHRMSTKEIRAVCVTRAEGWCECGCGRTLDLWGETMDHFLSGNGQRRQKQSVETCWMLTLKCHAGRQANLPSAAAWNDSFRRHCNSYGYPVIAHVEHAPVPRRSA